MKHLFTISLVFLVFTGLFSQITQTFTTTGTFTVPAGVTSITVQAWGAGGAGGSAVGTGAPTSYRAQAGGGGGGAYSTDVLTVVPGQVITYIVAPNTGANSTTGVVNGGSSTFLSVVALGGQGGESVNAATAGGHVGGLGGAGGIGTFNGGMGASRVGYSGSTTSGTSAGGGGGAGTTSNGGDANATTNVGGLGGASGGGAGAWAAASTTFRNGGAGARGEIRISYMAPLPVKFGDISVESKERSNAVIFSTYSEKNNDYFELERSSNGQTFEPLSKIQSVGDSDEMNSYQFIDENPLSSINYYRIKQVDLDGQSAYSNIVSTKSKANISISVSNENINIDSDAQVVDVMIMNTSGLLVRKIAQVSAQSIYIGDLVAGIYIINVQANGETYSQKVTKQ